MLQVLSNLSHKGTPHLRRTRAFLCIVVLITVNFVSGVKAETPTQRYEFDIEQKTRIEQHKVMQQQSKQSQNGEIQTMKWVDIHDIAIELDEAHEDVDPQYVNFVDLHRWVCQLESFDDDPQRSGEKILEAIQAAWIEEAA